MGKGVCCLAALLSLTAFSAEITVEWGRELGSVKPVNGVGQPPMIGAPRAFPLMSYLRRAHVPYSRLHDVGGAYGGMRYVDIPNIFRNFDADETDPKNYDFMATDRLMLALSMSEIEPFYRLGVTIENSVEGGFPAYRIEPPKDFAKWARVCEHVIRHYTEGWANGYRLKATHWEIWNEPENNPDWKINPMWQAPFEGYLRLYGTVAPYLKAKFPHLKIGGYGSCGFYAAVGADRIPAANSSPRTDYFVACAHKFLKAAQANKWPLDFFSFHSYSDPVEALRQVRFAREILDQYGFTSTETCFNEWLPQPSVSARGTSHQAAMIAAELIGLENGPCDSAMIYDARCGGGNYSPLFNPLTEAPHKAFFAFLSFDRLRQLGTAVASRSSDRDVWVTAAKGGEKGAVMLANYSKRTIPLSFDLGGRKAVSWCVTSPTQWDAYFQGTPKEIPADTMMVVFLDETKPAWERPQTTRRYLQGPRSSRLAVLFREGKLILGECVHKHNWQEAPYAQILSHGVWLTRGEACEPFDFKQAKLRVDSEAVPICGQVWREGDLEVDVEGCAPFGREPNAQMRVKVTNRGTTTRQETLSFLVRRRMERELVDGAPDGYAHYAPAVGDWIALDRLLVPEEDGKTVRHQNAFISFAAESTLRWRGDLGAACFDLTLVPGETKTLDCTVGYGPTEAPHYDETCAAVRQDWRKELARVKDQPVLIRNLTVQMLQCFARPVTGDFVLPRQGGLQRWVWPGDNRAVCAALDRLGYSEYVDEALDFYFGEYAQPDGEIGPFGNAWASDTASVLVIYAQHALALADEAVWKKHRAAAVKAFEWIRDTRATDGLFPPRKSADSESVFRNWGATDCANLEALDLLAEAAKRWKDPIADDVARVAADYRATIEQILDRWRRAAQGKDEFAIPFAPDGVNEEYLCQTFYYSHPGKFAENGLLNKDDLLRVRTWLGRTGVADLGRGLYMISRDGVPGRGAEGNFWYMTWAEHRWFKAWMRVGRKDLARQALEACLKYALTDEYMVGERYQAADPWLFPWSPNASGSGRIVQMLLDLKD